MVRRRDGKIFGVLNDYDLARVRGYSGPTSRQRTGTQPFMAMDLLDPDYAGDRTLPRFDIESLLYVLLWVACCGPGSKLPLESPLRIWRTADWATLLRDKHFIVTERKWPISNPSFKGLDDTLDEVGQLLRNGRRERTDARRPTLKRQVPASPMTTAGWVDALLRRKYAMLFGSVVHWAGPALGPGPLRLTSRKTPIYLIRWINSFRLQQFQTVHLCRSPHEFHQIEAGASHRVPRVARSTTPVPC